MDEVIKRLSQGAGEGVFSLPEMLLALGVATLCCLILAYSYRLTHRGLSYSVSYVHTLVIMGVTTAVIMLIIGSNIARAFSLVGALSIIRFRNAVKETRDVGFLFMSMAVGMAAGTGFYLVGMTFTVFMAVLLYALSRLGVGEMDSREVVLTIHLPEGRDHRTVFDSCFLKYLDDHSLLSMESVRGGTLLELVYSLRLKRGATEVELMSDLRKINDNHKVAILVGRDNAFV